MLIVAYGTRPEWIKIKPLIEELDKRGDIPYKLLFTGQHTDLLPKDARYDYKMEMTDYRDENRLDQIIVSVLDEFRFINLDYNNVKFLVQGDTTTAFAIALAAFHRKIPVIHLEAGMRSQNNQSPYPEEFNRRAISIIAETHLCPTNYEANWLRKENITGDIHVVGNTVLDNIVRISISCEKNILITLHRRENHAKLKEWFKAIDQLAEKYSDYDFIFPMHPNPEVQKHRHLLKHVKVTGPMEHEGFVDLLANCSAVITDSGGVQEEACFFGKKIFSLRSQKETERIDSNTLYVNNPQELVDWFFHEEKDWEEWKYYQCPYGNGYASKLIYKILKGM